jgi:hypothetical protein
MTRILRATARLSFLLSLPFAVVGVACSSSNNSGVTRSNGGDGGGCVVVDLTTRDLSCTADSDCTAVSTSFCPGYVLTMGSKLGTLCANAAANATGVAAVASAMAKVPHGDDAGDEFCDAAAGTTRCIHSQCALCGTGGGGCSADSGPSSSSSGGGEGDSGTSYAYCKPLTDAGTLCFAFPLTPGGPSAATVCAADSLDAFTWISVSSCAEPGLSGCCGMSDTWQCFYGTDSAMSKCTENGGTWSATSP